MGKDGYANVIFVDLPPVLVDIRQKDADGIPRHVVVRYENEFFSPEEAAELLVGLREYNVHGLNDGGNMYGVQWLSGRKTIQVSDPGVPVYKYTGSSAKHTEPFADYPILEYIRDILYKRTGYRFNFCLYNSYPLDSKLGWHSDAEKNMVDLSPIASLSFGFERRFRIRKMEGHEVVFDKPLESGSLLLMEEGCQKITEHCIWPLTEKQMEEIKASYGVDWEVETFRINLTYRMMVPTSQ